MSNRPSRKPSRSLPVQARARTKAERASRSPRGRWVVIAAVGVVVLAAAIGAVLWLRRDDQPAQLVLDAQATQGQQLATDKGCISCHTSDGARSEGPTWKGLYGHPVTLADGTTVQADDAYLSESIRQPDAKVVAGFQPGMPTTPLTDDEVAALVAYLKALG